ncbi:hypothetical protein [Clavibacter zhangzhiyongii]
MPGTTCARVATCFCAVPPNQTWSGCAASGKAGLTNDQLAEVPSGAPRV